MPDDKCWTLEKNKKDKPDKFGHKNNNKRLFSTFQMEQVTKALSKNALKSTKAKRQIAYTFNSNKESDRYVSPLLDYFNFAICGMIAKMCNTKP